MDVPYQSLLKVYFAERVAQELRRDRTADKMASLVREPEVPYGAAPAHTHKPRSAALRRVKGTGRGKAAG